MRIAIIALLVAAAPASASTSVVISGSLMPQGNDTSLSLTIGQLDVFGGGGGGGYLSNGLWRASFSFSAPAITQLVLGQVVTYDEYDLYDGSYLGGDDFFNIQVDRTYSGASGQANFKVDRSYTQIIPGYAITYNGFAGGAALYVDFGLITAPVTYEFRADRIGDVPEPASWALLIAGFGLVGAMQRRQRAIA